LQLELGRKQCSSVGVSKSENKTTSFYTTWRRIFDVSHPKGQRAQPGMGMRPTSHHLGIEWCLSFREALPNDASEEHRPSAQTWGSVLSTVARYGEIALKVRFILK